MMTIIDDFSRKLWVYFLKHKNEAFSTFKEWTLLIENQIGKKIKRLRTNNGLEFCSNEFNDFCKKEGISRHFTIPSTPQQNGAAERMNRTILEKVRSGNPVDYSNLKIFGCPAYSHVNEGKLEPCAKKCIFLGYGSGIKGYRLYNPESHKVIHSQNVTFNENAMLSSVKILSFLQLIQVTRKMLERRWSLRLKHPLMRKTFPIPPVLKMIKSSLLMVQMNI